VIFSIEPDFVLVLESAARHGEEPSHERKDALIRMVAHAAKKLMQDERENRLSIKLDDYKLALGRADR
jgi:hypothetical protein